MKPSKAIKPGRQDKTAKHAPAVPTNFASLKKLKYTLGFIIALYAFALYAQSIGFSYADDAVGIIKENSTIQKGISAIPHLLANDSWDGSIWNIRGSYRPVSVVMFAIEWHFFPDNPHVFHFVNVLLFAISCFLLFLLLCKLFSLRDSRNTGYNLIVPFVCTLLYAAHPIHSEVIDNIKSRDEILCFLFAIIAIFFCIKFVTKGSIILLIPAGISYFISLLSKEIGIAFLLIIPLLLFVFTKAKLKQLIISILVLTSVTIIFLFLRYEILNTLQTAQSINHMNHTFFVATSFIARQATAFYILLKYIFLLIVPHPLCYDYSYNEIPIQTFQSLPAIAGLIFYLLIGIFAFIKIRKKNLIAFSILFFLIALAPVANVFLVIGSTMAERFLYIPSLGFCILLTLLLMKLTKTNDKFKSGNIIQFFKSYSLVLIATLVLVCAYSVKTFSRSKDWKDDVTLFGHDVKLADKSARAHYNWGRSLSRYQYPLEKDTAKQSKMLDEAIIEMNTAISIDYDYYDFYILGDIYSEKNDFKNAILNYKTAMKINPKDRIDIYDKLGYLYRSDKQIDSAMSALDTALKYNPKSYLAHYNRAHCFLSKGNYDGALNEFQKTIDLNPKYEEAYGSMGIVYGIKEQYPKALEYFQKASLINPADVRPLNYLALTYKNMGDSANARLYRGKAEALKNSSKK